MHEKYSKSVLLVDDDPADRKLIARHLRKPGFNVIEAATADAAIANIVGGHIGCVITDQMMPVSGLELARSAQQVRSDMTVIFISGAGPKPDLPGDAVFIPKGEYAELVRHVEECMERWRNL